MTDLRQVVDPGSLAIQLAEQGILAALAWWREHRETSWTDEQIINVAKSKILLIQAEGQQWQTLHPDAK